MNSDNAVAAPPANLTQAVQADAPTELPPEKLPALEASPGAEPLEQAATDLQPEPQADPQTEQFLQIGLASSSLFLLPVASLVEIIKIPMEQVVPIFQMAPWVMGVYNCRGEVLWLVDLNQYLGMTPWYEQQGSATKHTAVIVQGLLPSGSAEDRQAKLGWVVSRVEGMVSCSPEAIEPLPADLEPAEVGARLLPFSTGCWRDASGAAQLILDSAAILTAMASSAP